MRAAAAQKRGEGVTPSIANCGYFLELGQRRGKRFVGGMSICRRALCHYRSVEAMVAQVISRNEEAGGAPYLELAVCRSSRHPDTVVAAWRHVDGAVWVWEGAVEIDPGAPVGFADRQLRRILEEADRQGVRFVLIDDPEGLFSSPYMIVGQHQ
jgi:hypothetical protein